MSYLKCTKSKIKRHTLFSLVRTSGTQWLDDGTGVGSWIEIVLRYPYLIHSFSAQEAWGANGYITEMTVSFDGGSDMAVCRFLCATKRFCVLNVWLLPYLIDYTDISSQRKRQGDQPCSVVWYLIFIERRTACNTHVCCPVLQEIFYTTNRY